VVFNGGVYRLGEVFYITTPIYYVNDVPHIGTAYTTLAADVMARYQRLRGREVFFLTGTDEHGQKVAQAAAEKNESPQAWADEMVSHFIDNWKLLNISNDDFIRTTQNRHRLVLCARRVVPPLQPAHRGSVPRMQAPG
jgi:methionyl-tRNA synthetase